MLLLLFLYLYKILFLDAFHFGNLFLVVAVQVSPLFLLPASKIYKKKNKYNKNIYYIHPSTTFYLPPHKIEICVKLKIDLRKILKLTTI